MIAALRLVLDGIAVEWCSWTHGGGTIQRDTQGRINWQCCKCGRWADPIPQEVEDALVDAAIEVAKERQERKP